MPTGTRAESSPGKLPAGVWWDPRPWGDVLHPRWDTALRDLIPLRSWSCSEQDWTPWLPPEASSVSVKASQAAKISAPLSTEKMTTRSRRGCLSVWPPALQNHRNTQVCRTAVCERPAENGMVLYSLDSPQPRTSGPAQECCERNRMARTSAMHHHLPKLMLTLGDTIIYKLMESENKCLL